MDRKVERGRVGAESIETVVAKREYILVKNQRVRDMMAEIIKIKVIIA